MRKLSAREKAMMAVLAVLVAGAAWYLAVWQPSSEAVRKATSELADVRAEMPVEAARAERMAQMEKELERAGDDGGGSVMDRLASALSGREYSISFDGKAARVTFAAGSMEQAADVARAVGRVGKVVALAFSDGRGGVSASVDVELAEDAGAAGGTGGSGK